MWRVIRSYDELNEWYRRSGLPLKRVFNTSGMLYKEMQLKDKLPAMSERGAVKATCDQWNVGKTTADCNEEDTVLAGFKEAEWKEKLK